MKRLVFILAILISIGFSSVYAKNKEVAVLFPGTVEFFSVQRKGMDDAAKKYNLDVIYADAEWDAGKQLSQVENFVAKGVDLILLCAADGQALLPAIDIAKAAKIPLITFTNALGSRPDGIIDGVVSFIGTDEVAVGRLLGKMAEKLLGDQPANIVLIEGTPGTPPQRMRTQGFKQVVDNHANWKIIYQQAIPGWTKEGALAAMEAVLQRGEKFNLVATHWNAAASAASIALEEANYSNDVFITGLEFSKELVPLIQEEKVHMTSNYSIYSVGYLTIEAAAKHLSGIPVQRFIEIEPTIVSKLNLHTVKPEL